jgi:hypothetical protein
MEERAWERGADVPVGDLVRHLTEQAGTLARQEVRLAQLELVQKGKAIGLGVGFLGSAGFLGALALAALFAAAGAALAIAIPVWASILVVTGLLGGFASVFAFRGRTSFHAASPPAPQATVASVRADVETIKENAHR